VFVVDLRIFSIPTIAQGLIAALTSVETTESHATEVTEQHFISISRVLRVGLTSVVAQQVNLSVKGRPK